MSAGNERLRDAPAALEQKIGRIDRRLEDIVNAIPGGVAVYRVSERFETVYFSDGVAALTGYSPEEYRALLAQDAAALVFEEDRAATVARALDVVRTHETAVLELRKRHRDGRIVWVRAQIAWLGEDEGLPLLHCVFHNISDLKDAQLEMHHLLEAIPGGIASYRVEGDCFIPTFYSEGVPALSGHTREEFESVLGGNALNIIHETDRPRVLQAARAALASGGVLDISYRLLHKDGRLVWVHLNGRRIGPLGDVMRFYAVFTGMSEETRLFQSVADEVADGIYVIDRESYELLYYSESEKMPAARDAGRGRKCHEFFHGLAEPCPFCTLRSHPADGKPHRILVPHTQRFYNTRFRETVWNGIPAYIKYLQDVTSEVHMEREKERLEQYFRNMVRYIPGGLAVVRCEQDRRLIPEFISEGFAALTCMSMDEAWALYEGDAMRGVHPDDRARVSRALAESVDCCERQTQESYRLRRGDGSYVWVRNTLTTVPAEDGTHRLYAVFHDMTAEREEQARLRQQYSELILQHYRSAGPDALIIGHCNVSSNRVLELIDRGGNDLLATFGTERERVFIAMSDFIVEPEERRAFLAAYLNAPMLAAFRGGQTEVVQRAFARLPGAGSGCYAEFRVSLVQAPDTGDVTGILTVTDVTEATIRARSFQQLAVTSCDLVVDVDLLRDHYRILSAARPELVGESGALSARVAAAVQANVTPKDGARMLRMMEPGQILDRLAREGAYTFSYTRVSDEGERQVKSLTFAAADLRLGRVCVSRNDITASVREQRSLLRGIASAFELLTFVDLDARRMTIHTRETVLDDLPPEIVEEYEDSLANMRGFTEVEGDREAVLENFRMATLLRNLAERPEGYDFVLPYQAEDGLRYKQVNVLWAEAEHRRICMLRADVTDILAAERAGKRALEEALAMAQKANAAKSDFLSRMRHDIRTPMNAIIGMTELAAARPEDAARVTDCLDKIRFSSQHLLNLINDILDMSRIERAKMSLNRETLRLERVVEQLSAMVGIQAREAGIDFEVRLPEAPVPAFLGDLLRLNQVLLNLLSNAIRFTPAGGAVRFLTERLEPEGEGPRLRLRFTVRDTGVGMSPEFLPHAFEPFSRSTQSAHVDGTGLGLAITKGLVELMGGTLSVESREGEGSTFRVELEFDVEDVPRAGAPDCGRLADEAVARLLAGRRFLIVEDNDINAEILSQLLEMQGAECQIEPDGERALNAFRAAAPGAFDAILMDIRMPVMNGYEATRAIRALPRPDAAAIPIVAMTANAFDEDVRAALAAGMDAHVAKPIDVPGLWATLDRLLGGTAE